MTLPFTPLTPEQIAARRAVYQDVRRMAKELLARETSAESIDPAALKWACDGLAALADDCDGAFNVLVATEVALQAADKLVGATETAAWFAGLDAAIKMGLGGAS